ncbi:hypothetical protein GF382_00150 [Candidatus Falkowbacteria bacterium]|nr:hypothetical protein [Candidatus Falkowbacteria bacterium]
MNGKMMTKNNFWTRSKKPIIALAPMADITDAPFRYLCESFGADVIYNEMVNVDAICFRNEKTLAMLKRYKSKKPFVVQLFGNKPENFSKAVKIIEKECAPDGYDINFGCPAPKVLKNKCGAELFQDLDLSRAVISAVIGATKKPVSVKTRIKAGKVDILAWLEHMKDLPITAIMVHARKLSQGLSGPIDLKTLKEVKKKFKGIVLGNGGIADCQDAQDMIKKTGVDGIGIAQGCLGKPWLFKELKKKREKRKDEKEVFKIILKHARIHKKLYGDNMMPMRKHLCWYVNGLSGAKELRKKLVEVNTYKDIERALKKAR